MRMGDRVSAVHADSGGDRTKRLGALAATASVFALALIAFAVKSAVVTDNVPKPPVTSNAMRSDISDAVVASMHTSSSTVGGGVGGSAVVTTSVHSVPKAPITSNAMKSAINDAAADGGGAAEHQQQHQLHSQRHSTLCGPVREY